MGLAVDAVRDVTGKLWTPLEVGESTGAANGSAGGSAGIATGSPESSTAMNTTTLSRGPSMNSCSCECWSTAPSAGSGVAPACTVRPERSNALPSDSAHSCWNQSAKERSRSLYGIST